ncbi:MAG: large conductance mechanosensitive channel protein MscL [Acidimicrobiia bacterium]|nr:large conductance mechanosensitive channel protein MscL [Acidimicrobiia bacterium]
MKEFKEFALGGNLVEIAVGLVMALALAALIGSLVEHVLMPIVGIIFGQPSFDQVAIIEINESRILLGTFITSVVTFLSIAFAVYFFVVKPYNAYKARVASGEEEAPAGPSELDLLTEIRDALARN